MNDHEFAERARRIMHSKGAPPQADPPAADMVNGILSMVAKADTAAEKETEYLDETTGLLRCRTCGGPRQTIITPPFEGAKPRTVRCWCKCPTEEDTRKERELREKFDRRRRVCFQITKAGGVSEFESWTFDRDDRKRPELSDHMRQYAEQFPQNLREGKGLLLYGDVGGGKSCLAAMIANAVIDQGYTARMTNFEDIGNDLWSAEEKSLYMDELRRYDLLILDDLGAERQSSYMQGIVYNVVDARCRAGKPVIVTTNLTTDELAKTDEMGYKRIYDRLLHRCLPVKVDGQSRRRQEAGKTWGEMRRRMGMEVKTE